MPQFAQPLGDVQANRARWAGLGVSKTAVVTGANAGLGFFTALALADSGATVVMACRNQARAERAAAQIRQRVPMAKLEFMQFDADSLASAVGLAAELRGRAVDVLVANAGAIHTPRTRQPGLLGYEQVMTTNAIGHLRLVGELAASFAQHPLRFIALGSMSTLMLRADAQNLELVQGYHPYRAYAQSKAVLQAFGLGLDRRLRQLSWPARSITVHPGYSISGLTPQIPDVNEPGYGKRLQGELQAGFAQGKHQGAVAIVEAALNPELAAAPAGMYLGPKYVSKGPIALASPAKITRGKQLQQRAWEVFVEANDGFDPFAPSALS